MKKTYISPTLRSFSLETSSSLMATSVPVKDDHYTNEQYSESWSYDDAFATSDASEED